MLAYMVAQVPSIQQVHHQIEVLSVLEGVVHVDDLRVIEAAEDLLLVHDRLDAALCDNASLGHLLHRVMLLSLLALDSPHLAEASLSDAIEVGEIRFS